jgi:DNA-binding response OmpR family regulator
MVPALVSGKQPLIAMDLAIVLENAGAQVTTTTTLKYALLLAERDGLAGVIVDHSLVDGDTSALRARLPARSIAGLRSRESRNSLSPLRWTT